MDSFRVLGMCEDEGARGGDGSTEAARCGVGGKVGGGVPLVLVRA